LFSATLPQSIRAIAERHLRDPQHVKIQTKTQTVTAIEQAHLLVHADQKTSAVLSLLEVEDFDALIMFVRTKQATLDLASALEAKGYKAAALNGDIAQNQRERVIDSSRMAVWTSLWRPTLLLVVWTFRASPTCSTLTCRTIQSPTFTVSAVPAVPVAKVVRCCW
jgi:ATP-dependent RNA helicase DeaD